jgi:hypothetical protein
LKTEFTLTGFQRLPKCLNVSERTRVGGQTEFAELTVALINSFSSRQIFKPTGRRRVCCEQTSPNFRERGSFVHESHPANFALTEHFADAGWRQRTACEPEVHWLDGEHNKVLKPPQVKRTTEELKAAMATHFASISWPGAEKRA